MNMYIRSFTYHIKIQALPFEQVSWKKVLDEYSPDTNLPGPLPIRFIYLMKVRKDTDHFLVEMWGPRWKLIMYSLIRAIFIRLFLSVFCPG